MESLWKEIAPAELLARMQKGEALYLLDVRTAPEVMAYHIPGVRWIPLQELAQRVEEIPLDEEVILLCEHGVRSVYACHFLAGQGFPRLGNLTGGMSGWAGETRQGLPQ